MKWIKIELIDIENRTLIVSNTISGLKLNSAQYIEYWKLFKLNNVNSWSLDKTSMYYVNSAIISDNEHTIIDNIDTKFGFRTTA